MKSKGFTLVEILGVLIILSILGLIVSQIIIKKIQDIHLEMANSAKDIIISSARDYVSNNPLVYVKNKNKTYCLSYSTLKDSEYLNELMVPNLKEVSYLKKYFIKIKYNGNLFDYEVVENCTAV
ncbi:MAG: prepilin-type N-terminal cleavage/methylation domain-containing protein [Bacilli bacterium]